MPKPAAAGSMSPAKVTIIEAPESTSPLPDRNGITELALLSAGKARRTDRTLGLWKGDAPRFAALRREEGELIVCLNSYPDPERGVPGENGRSDPGFHKAIEQSPEPK